MKREDQQRALTYSYMHELLVEDNITHYNQNKEVIRTEPLYLLFSFE